MPLHTALDYIALAVVEANVGTSLHSVAHAHVLVGFAADLQRRLVEAGFLRLTVQEARRAAKAVRKAKRAGCRIPEGSALEEILRQVARKPDKVDYFAPVYYLYYEFRARTWPKRALEIEAKTVEWSSAGLDLWEDGLLAAEADTAGNEAPLPEDIDALYFVAEALRELSGRADRLLACSRGQLRLDELLDGESALEES